MSGLRRGSRLLCLLCLGAAMVPAATAQDLPWPDANPLQSIDRPSRPAAAQKRRTRPLVAQAPAESAVPTPEARPDTAEDADGAESAAPVDDKEAATKDNAADEDTAADEDAAADTQETGPAPAADAEAATETPEPADASSADNSDTPPTGDIPTPDARPDRASDAPDEPAEPEPAPDEPAEPQPEPAAAEPATDEPARQTKPIPDAMPVTPAVPEADEEPLTPTTLRQLEQSVTPAASVLAAAAIADAVACEAELTERGVVFTVEPSISEGACGVLRPVNVERLSSGIAVSPKTQLLCRAALALDEWMSSTVVPAARVDLEGRALTEFRHASTYVCRKRASESGISEHARGSAIDIAAFVFDEGPEISVEAQPAGSPEAKFQRAVRVGACGPFRTVLGPGTDADHATHFHLDIAARKNDGTYCK
ncbi:extensin family protein [Aurantimonas sp. HBX-1]|uniref:extensin family protein n=1 Tax=Aurantimonas sp. HBX-1 TaxID=2906072 RepID=UPI001F3ED414|nr:extensin family protein [Aurantimonas sp. HBX-1]UIJ72470.1 extensin family protein [Aurantimonas sp. HBX-1]